MIEFYTIMEMAKIRKVSRRVNTLCIQGNVLKENRWLIPFDAKN